MGGFPKFSARLNNFLHNNGFAHTTTSGDVKKSYSYRELKKRNVHELIDPSVQHRAYDRVQEWRSDPVNATMLAIVQAATVA